MHNYELNICPYLWLILCIRMIDLLVWWRYRVVRIRILLLLFFFFIGLIKGGRFPLFILLGTIIRHSLLFSNCSHVLLIAHLLHWGQCKIWLGGVGSLGWIQRFATFQAIMWKFFDFFKNSKLFWKTLVLCIRVDMSIRGGDMKCIRLDVWNLSLHNGFICELPYFCDW